MTDATYTDTILKPWGFEEWIAVFPDQYVVKVIHVDAGESLSLQRHEHKHETQFYLQGHARIEHGHTLESLEVVELLGDGGLRRSNAITFPPGEWHRITAVTDVVFAEVQTARPGWEHDIERRADKYGREGTTAPVVSTESLAEDDHRSRDFTTSGVSAQ